MTRKDVIIKLIIGFLIQATFLCGVIYLSYSRFNSYEQAVRESYRAKTIDTDIDRLEKSVLRVNSSIRGYNLTGNKYYLDQFNKDKLEVNINDLEKAVTDIPYQLERAKNLKELIRERIETIEKNQTNVTFQAASPFVEKGEILNQNIRKLTQEMRVREATLLEERTKEAEKKAEEFQNYIIGIVLSDAIVLLFGFVVLGKSYFFRLGLEDNLRESNEELKVVYNSVNDSLVAINEHSMIIYCNDSVQEMLGYSPTELIGRNLTDIMPEEFRQGHLNGMSRYLQSGVKKLDWKMVEIPCLNKKGEEFPAAISFGEYEINNQRRFIGVIRNISDRINKEKQLLKLNEELNAFTSSASHDLQNPIRNIISMSQLMLLRYEKDIPKDAVGYLNKVIKNGENMSKLVKDLLEFSRSGKFQKSENVDVKSLLDNINDHLPSHKCNIKIGDMPTIKYPESAISQIFTNLLSNGIKFSSEGCDISIECVDKGKYYKFLVKDNGIGINKEYHDKIFEPFERLGTDVVEGTGLGLGIVKKLVEINNGEIGVESEGKGKGSTFFFTVIK